jgi:hypothetical protein
VRWLIDTAGANSEPGVLHDAVWRESKRTDGKPKRVDPWDADGLFRKALRQSGATAITRALMWIAVRVAAIARLRFGHEGPSVPWKLVQVLGMLPVAAVAIGIPTIVAVVGRGFYWIVEWLVAGPAFLFEKHRKSRTNLPWPFSEARKRKKAKTEAQAKADEHAIKGPPEELLMVIRRDTAGGRKLAELLGTGNDQVLQDEDLLQLPKEELAAAV